MNTRSPIPPLLAVDNLGKSFGGVRAVDGIGFTLAPGELLALVLLFPQGLAGFARHVALRWQARRRSAPS